MTASRPECQPRSLGRPRGHVARQLPRRQIAIRAVQIAQRCWLKDERRWLRGKPRSIQRPCSHRHLCPAPQYATHPVSTSTRSGQRRHGQAPLQSAHKPSTLAVGTRAPVASGYSKSAATRRGAEPIAPPSAGSFVTRRPGNLRLQPSASCDARAGLATFSTMMYSPNHTRTRLCKESGSGSSMLELDRCQLASTTTINHILRFGP